MKLQKSLISLALISILGACGGGGSDSKSTTPTPMPTPTPTPTPTLITTTIDGKAIKGTIANAIVTVYKYVDGQAVQLIGEELNNTSIKTEADGSYTVTIKDYDGAIKVELSVGPDTTMICDAPAGCADVAFRAPIALATVDPTLILSAISTVGSANNGAVNVNISALTHLTSALIEAAEGGVNAQSIQQQSSIIANAFNVSGSLTELEPTLVDSASAVASEDNFNELRYGLINSGIMSALFSGQSNASNIMSTSLASAVNDLIANDGALLINQDENVDGFELSLVDVLNGAGEAANAAAEAIAADPELATNTEMLTQLEQEETNLENQSEFAQANAGDNGRIDPVVEQPTEGDAIAKAKAMVEDIRLFSHLFEVGTDSNSAISGEGEAYVTLIEEAGVMVETEAASFLLLAEIADAITQLSAMHESGTLSGTEFPIDEYLSLEGAEGTITFDEETANGGILFSVNALSGTEVVKISIEAVIAEDGKDVTLNLDGSIESTGAKLVLADGSFAKINLDSAISRTTLEDDTFEGEITSGELELSVTLEQKTTTSVTNPVKFSGLVKTKLIPKTVPALSVEYIWNENNNTGEFSVEPEVKTVVLPEMLTLSGGFSSAEGNLIKATLTASIKDLESYQAPDFKYIGKPVESIATISFSDDKNTIIITESDMVNNEQQTTETRVFTPGSQVGEWSATSSVVSAFPEEHYWGTGIERKIITKRFDSGITEQGTLYTRAYISGASENNFGAKSVRITPKDYNSDNLTDGYDIDIIDTNWDSDDKEYDATSLSTLIDADGNILTSDGNVHPRDTAWTTWGASSIEQFMMDNEYQLIANPLTVNNGAELLAQTIANWWKNKRSATYDDIGEVTAFFSEEDLVNIANSQNNELSPATYLTKALLKDAYTVNVSVNSQTVVVKDEVYTRTYDLNYTSQGNFVFDREIVGIDQPTIHDIRTFSTIDSGLDVPEITLFRVNTFDGNPSYTLLRNIPVDTNGDNKVDYFDRAMTSSGFINADGVLVDENGNPIAEMRYLNWSEDYAGTFGDWRVPFDVLAINNGLDAYKAWLINIRDSKLYAYIDGIGNVDSELSQADIDSFKAGETITFDAYVTTPSNIESLENNDVFLDVNAALSLETILGDYQVNVMLSGDRTALNEGKFDLDMQYKLPDESAMRKFSVHMKTDEASRMTMSNSEGVLMVLKEPEEGSTSNVIGTIVVTTSAEKVADIEDRDGAIVIVYSNGEVETL